MLHTNTRLDPFLLAMHEECYARTPEQQQDEEELMMLELIRSYPPEMRSRIEHDFAYGAWKNAKPSQNQNLPY